MLIKKELILRGIRKAKRSPCRFKICAIGLNHRGEITNISTNGIRFNYKYGGLHAETNVMRRSNKGLKFIILLRVGERGNILPIQPCIKCKQKAKELGVKILVVTKG
jgi:hypothetical protein